MPIYEYKCLECGTRFEKFQRFGDPQAVTCPNGHEQVHRLLSQPAIIFKGSGFYSTDHGRNGHSSRPAPKKRTEKESEPAAAAKTDQPAES
jgi:putative FmdB family regulatory protein